MIYNVLCKCMVSDGVNRLFNRLGLSSGVLGVSTATAQTVDVQAVTDVVYQSFTLADVALTISATGGLLFCVEKVLVIYLKLRDDKHRND